MLSGKAREIKPISNLLLSGRPGDLSVLQVCVSYTISDTKDFLKKAVEKTRGSRKLRSRWLAGCLWL